jgi:PTS system mannose-specific IIB component
LGKINLARVDERLIHGQVMTTLTKRAGVNSIFVVDDEVANDSFMKNVYKTAGSRTGQKTIVMTTEKCKHYWDEFEFKEYNAIVIAKTVDTFYELAKHGIPMKELNLGGMPQKNEETDIQVSGTVSMNKDDAMKLKELHEDYGVEDIYLQATPSDSKVSLDQALAKFDL